MSSFYANSISIDPVAKTFKVKGGDNNVLPRDNDWTNPIAIVVLLSYVDGRMIQFKTRSDKNIYYETLVDTYSKKLNDLTGLSPYDLQCILEERKPIAEYRAQILESIADNWQLDRHEGLLKLVDNPDMLAKVYEIRDEFIADVIKPYKVGERFVVMSDKGTFIEKMLKNKAVLTSRLDKAYSFSKTRAEEVEKKVKAYGFSAVPFKTIKSQQAATA